MRVVVVMPARNESKLITKSIESIPKSVDWIIVIDDGSTDHTASLAKDALADRGEVVSTTGLGVGGAIKTGSQLALTRFGTNIAVVVMAGDGQMDSGDYRRLSSQSFHAVRIMSKAIDGYIPMAQKACH